MNDFNKHHLADSFLHSSTFSVTPVERKKHHYLVLFQLAKAINTEYTSMANSATINIKKHYPRIFQTLHLFDVIHSNENKKYSYIFHIELVSKVQV